MVSINHSTPSSKPRPIPPTRRNGVEIYLRRYLNSVSDWNTYLATGSLEGQAKAVTGAFFGARVLKGAALLLGAHLTQQATASAASLLVRGWLRGQELATHGGIAVRKLEPATLRRRQPWPQTETLAQEWRLFLHFSGLRGRCAETRAAISRRVQLHDHYYFTEGGRTWLCYTLRFPNQGSDRTLTALTLLSFPNRSYYFDRLLPFNLAVDLARGRSSSDDIPGFIGHVNELDLLLPLVRLFKLGLYGLNWYLVDPGERDSGPAPDVAGYNNLLPPNGQGSGSQVRPYSVQPRGGQGSSPAPYATPPNSYYGYTGGDGWRAGAPSTSPTAPPPPPPPPGDSFGAPPAPASFPPRNNASANLAPGPVKVYLELQNQSAGQNEQVWVAIEEEAYLVLDSYQRPTGLAVAPAVSLADDGSFVTHPQRWHIVHLETGRALNAAPLPSPYETRQLASQLLAAADWRRPFEQMTPQERARARAILNGQRP
jgi:hypothetical protein